MRAKRGVLGLVAAAMLGAGVFFPATSPAQALAPRSSASVVMVGHSLINYDMPNFLGHLASSRNLTYSDALQVIIGSPLKHNYENCRRASSTAPSGGAFAFSCDAIDAGTPSGPYDTLILTEGNNGIANKRQYSKTDDYVALYMEMFLKRNRSGRVLLFTSWEALPTYGSQWLGSQAADLAQYEDIARTAAGIAASRGTNGTVEVIPVNIALRDLIAQAEGGRIPGVTSRSAIFMDDVHMTRLGNYFVACVVFSAVYGRSPEGGTGRIPSPYSSQPPLLDLPQATAAALQRLAWDVVSTYRTGSAPARPKPPGSFTVR